MKKKIFLLCIAAATVILEALPYGVVMNFANPEGEPWSRTYSYFSLVPYGYANFAPLIVALLTCAILILTVVSIITKKTMRRAIVWTSVGATVLTPASLLGSVTVIGVFIFILLLSTTVLAFYWVDK